MTSHFDMIQQQAKYHESITTRGFKTPEKLALHQIHLFPYYLAAHLASGKCVLDLGCNNGYGTRILHRTANSVNGVDVSGACIQQAKLEHRDTSINFQVTDGTQLPFPDQQFDMIVSYQVVEHQIDPGDYLEEIKRTLKPTGLVLLTTPNASIRLLPGMKPINKFHAKEYTADTLQQLLAPTFSSISIFGLNSHGEVGRIERQRLRKNLEELRQNPTLLSRILKIAKVTCKVILPETIVAGVRNMKQQCRSHYTSTEPEVVTPEMEKKLSRDPLFYSKVSDQTLDLLAMCTDNPEEVIRFENQITSFRKHHDNGQNVPT